MTTTAEEIRSGDRRALAQGITLVESVRPDHRAEAVALVEELLPASGGAVRVGRYADEFDAETLAHITDLAREGLDAFGYE